jgi:leader peptidase (prepilin peptidase) / N-methyltransferase
MNELLMSGAILILGAYLGAVADRFSYWFHVSRAMIWSKHCNKCFSLDAWMTFLPIFGFVMRRGVCVMCKEQLPIAPFFAEVLSAVALLFVWAIGWGGKLPVDALGWAHAGLVIIILVGMIVLFISDLVYDEVPFGVYLLTLCVLIARLAFFSDTQTFVYAVFAGILSGFIMALLVIVSRWRWVHAHDILFGILIGFIVGWPGFFVTLACAYIFAVIGGMFEWGWEKKLWKGTSSYGLYLFVALAVNALLQVIALLSD